MSTSEEMSRFRNFGGQQHVVAVDEAFDKSGVWRTLSASHMQSYCIRTIITERRVTN